MGIKMKIAVLGYGTVGSGVVEGLYTNHSIISKRAGETIEIKYVLDLRKFPGDRVAELLVDDYEVIINDPEIGIIVEAMGGIEPAYTFVKRALQEGKSVCTSNKELVAKHGAELVLLAKEKKKNFFFEASVGGGIPVLRPMNQSITADRIELIMGILNGTTNYILTRMREEGLEFEEALIEAQELGYAEKDPSADIDGLDAARKMAILMSIAYGRQADFEDIYVEGISKISKTDISYAKAMGAEIKLLGFCQQTDHKLFAMVSPRLLWNENPLYHVNGVYNGILVRGNILGDVMFYGSGAGSLPTASAIISDMIEAVKEKDRHVPIFWNAEKMNLSMIDGLNTRFFLRVPIEEKDQVLSSFSVEREIMVKEISGEFACITKPILESEFKSKTTNLTLKGRIRL